MSKSTVGPMTPKLLVTKPFLCKELGAVSQVNLRTDKRNNG
jgi:hypothetical protein